MSRRQIRWMRALVNGFLAALAILVMSSFHVALAQTPANRLTLLPLAQGLQQQLVLVNRLQAPQPPLRTVVLPPRAPLPAAAGQPWEAQINPLTLLAALREQGAGTQAAAGNALFPAPLRQPLTVAASLLAATAPAPTAAASPRPHTLAPAFRRPRPVAAAVDLEVTEHHSLVVQSPVPLKRVSITDDSIAQAIVVSPNQVLVQGRQPGEVSLLLWDANSDARAYTVRVRLDPAPLQAELERLYPGADLGVSASGDAMVVRGTLPNAATAKRVLEIAGGFSKHVINDLNVDGASDPAQVLLQVRFAEIDRSAVAQFGASLISTATGMVGSVGTGQFGGASSVIAPPSQSKPTGSSALAGKGAEFGLNELLNVFLFRSSANLGLTLQALEQQNLLQILAEPNLVAMDGKEASFLAGGEFPFPVVQGQGSVNNVTIQFKPFGVNLHFKPTILPDGTIDLQVSPEVSALDFSNALTVSGFVIPALSTRRASTELELRDGQSFVIAGLMDNRLTKNISKIPGLSDIPILGKFFTSQNTNKSRTELMVVVTAHLVHASNGPVKKLAMPQPFLSSQKFDGGHK